VRIKTIEITGKNSMVKEPPGLDGKGKEKLPRRQGEFALLFKIDMVRTTDYWQQIKTFRLKFIFLAGKIIRTTRSVVMKLLDRYPYREML
jgi:hypothetical protein